MFSGHTTAYSQPGRGQKRTSGSLAGGGFRWGYFRTVKTLGLFAPLQAAEEGDALEAVDEGVLAVEEGCGGVERHLFLAAKAAVGEVQQMSPRWGVGGVRGEGRRGGGEERG